MNENDFVREVRGFLFYSKILWPLHRSLLGKTITPRCKRCIVSANYSKLNAEGLCEYCCTEPAVLKKSASNLASELDQTLKSFQGKGPGSHDALVLFSGGKDSFYLVHKLRQDYPQLRLLLLTVDNTIMSPIAMNNVKQLVQQFDLDAAIVRPPAELYNKMFRYAFLHLNAKGCSGTVDQFDGDFFHDVARNWAAQLKIPLLLSGCSFTQVTRILGLNHFESPRSFEEARRSNVAGIELKDIFTPAEMRYWWDGTRWPKQDIPRVIYPHYAWNLEETVIKQKVREWGMPEKDSDNPILTNNLLVPMMALVDMAKYGYSSFEPEFSQMVREGKADPHFWRPVFEMSEYAAKTGHFVSKSVDNMLVRLNLRREDVGLPS